MINGNASDFIENLSYEDNYALFHGNKYFFNGCQVRKNDKGKIIEVRLEVYNLTENTTVFSVKAHSIQKCIEAFENAEFFDGKTFWEAENEIEWIDD